MITLMRALSRATSVPDLNWSMWVAWRDMACLLGSMTIRALPAFAAFLKKVAATGWFSVELAPMTMITSESDAAMKGAVTAAEPMVSKSAITDEAWQSRVQ